MLKEIIAGTERVDLVLILDSLEARGRDLLKAFGKSHLQQGFDVNLICCERPGSEWRKSFQAQNFHIHDNFSDPCGWLEVKGCIHDNTDIYDYLRDKCNSGKATVIVDSLTGFLLAQNVTGVSRSLHRLRTMPGVEQVVCILHENSHREEVVRSLKHMARATLHVERIQETLRCQILHKKLSGKVIKQVEEFSLSEDYELTYSKPIMMLQEASSTSEQIPRDPMASLTTFKLTLEESEKEARSKLVLPYLKPEQTASLRKGVEGCKIYYQPDDADDWDEEDPDDDLDL